MFEALNSKVGSPVILTDCNSLYFIYSLYFILCNSLYFIFYIIYISSHAIDI